MNNFKMEDKQWKKSSFTVSFHFSNGLPQCEGFIMETVVSKALKLKYRILAKHPKENSLFTMKGMEKPMLQNDIQHVINTQHGGQLISMEFAFEVFEETGKRKLFATKFNAEERIPAEGYGNEHLVATSFSWSFDLPKDLQDQAKAAIEKYFAAIS